MGHTICFHSPPLIRCPMYHLFLSALFMSPNLQMGAHTQPISLASTQGDQSTALPKTSHHCSTTQIRTVPMHTSSAWLSCEPCDVRVGMYIVFAYGVKCASMGRYCGDYAQVPRVLI